MKKTISVYVLVMMATALAFAQTDPKAKAILTEVSKKYRSYNILRAEVTIGADIAQLKGTGNQSGTLYLQSAANKYRFTLPDQELISDGKTQWTWLKDEKEVQVSAVSGDEGEINPARIFLLYEKGFKYLYTGESKIAGRTVQMVELSPIDTRRPYFKIKLSIDKLLKQIKTAVIYDKNGGRYTYTIRSLIPAAKTPASFFTFDPKTHPGVEVVDLR